MKNLYTLLNIKPNANLEDILNAYQTKCFTNPNYIFEYTIALSILTNIKKRMLYDASIYQINLLVIFNNYYNDYLSLYEIDEFELANFIGWLEDFKNYIYDTKYQTNNQKYHIIIEEWYNNIDNIIENLKNEIKTFYLI